MSHSLFNWWWIHVPTFEPYLKESDNFPSFLTAREGSNTATSAIIVLKSLTSNAREAFRILVDSQLKSSDNSGDSKIFC